MFKQLAPGVLVSGQIFEADLAKAKDMGVSLIITGLASWFQHRYPVRTM